MKSNLKNPSTLKQVAAAAGVSVSTASRSLTGKAKEYRISETTEQAVRQAAEQLGFRPSQVARSLRSQRTGLLGVVVPDLANPFFAAITREITLAAEEGGFAVLVADSRDTTDTERQLVEQLAARRVEALVVCPVGKTSSHLAELEAFGLPVILVDRGFPDSSMVTVTSDHRRGAAKVAELLTRQGHRAIGILQGVPGTLSNDERLAGIRQTFTSAGIAFDASLVRGDQFSESSGYEAARWLIGHHADITALIALSNQNSLGALQAAAELGYRIPDDLSLVTFDDHPFADFLATPLSTACQDVAELGRLAAKLIIERVKSGKRPRKTLHRVAVKVIERASVARAQL